MGACASIACGSCPDPGKCCRHFVLTMDDSVVEPSGNRRPGTALEVMAQLATVEQPLVGERLNIGLPFVPLFRHHDRALYGNARAWRYWCPNLGSDGRCADYENRPMVCSNFDPASTSLCAIWRPPPACERIYGDIERAAKACGVSLSPAKEAA